MKKIYMTISLLSMINFSHSQIWNIGVINTSNSQIPSDDARLLALDKNDQLWVGTTNGIGLFSNNLWTTLLVDNRIDEIFNVAELNHGVDVFFRPYLFIISPPFSGIPSKTNESSISGSDTA